MAGSILGASVKRVEDPRFITGTGTYLGDIHVEGELHMAVVRSTVPHAVVTSIDTEVAAAMPGVVGIYTAGDFEGMRMPIAFGGSAEELRRPLIAADRVRYVGDIVAVVLAETAIQAADAADEVWPDYDELPANVDPFAAAGPEAPVLYPELGSNVVKTHRLDPAVEAPSNPDDIEFQVTVDHQRLAPIPLEPNSALSIPTDDGGLDVWAGSQAAGAHQNAFSTTLGIDRKLIRVRVPDMGGGFGAKITAYPEQVLTGALALKTGLPVRWDESRRENMVTMVHGRAQYHTVTVRATPEGRIRRLHWDIIQDAGAYALFGADMPAFTIRMTSGPYDIPEVTVDSVSVVTNTTPIHAYRGAGRPEATLTLERVMDVLAHELGLDPAEVRRRNAFAPEAFPVVTATGERYDSGRYVESLDLALARADYTALRAEQQRRRQTGERWQLGIGMSLYVEITAGGGRKEWGRVEIDADGAATVFSAAASHGQSHETTFAQIAAQVLGVSLSDIRFVQSDTGRVKRGGGTMASRSLQLAGSAIKHAADAVVDKARAIVAHRLEAQVDDVVQFDDGRIGVAGVPDTGMSLGDIAALAQEASNLPPGMEPGLDAEDLWEQDHATVPFGSHVSVVEVDTETGDVRLVTHVACDDPGTVFSRMVVDGQVHGGVAQGIGQALFERFRYDEFGTPLSGNLTSYLVPTAATMPDIVIDRTETATDLNVLGAKGIGEAGTIGSTAAAANAVIDALGHLGVTELPLPLTPDVVWAAING